MRKGTHTFNPWEVGADSAMVHLREAARIWCHRESTVVTQQVPRLHWCDVTMRWCFRTGTWQTCRGSENTIIPFRANLLLNAKGS